MKKLITTLIRDSRASSAAEFALVLPLLLIFLLGIFDVGRLMWTWNRAEKATQMGVRYAVATDPVATGIATYSFATGASSIAQGASIGTSYFSSMTCTSTTCGSCSGSACNSLITPYNSTAFTNIVNRMRAFLPELGATNVEVQYSNSGIGYSGDPNGPDIAPLVTVRVKGMAFQPILLMLFKTSITLPSFSAALTMEDGQGTASN
ncbi:MULTISPECIES: TadE/TadG family type IV pilus assembly protein [unclassified Sphingobium]|uniref:TadE/TadG family type IV pilus assembly protein n=1 Tax=unclassified Sphingobium TaxID=2611147 RepID=UPI00076FF3F8|nr:MULTISPECIES: TadE/TadG family type IV pilus assembly protein [Sphingomonadaceae]AMK22815.1 TadE family protein [Sphingobium sp. TKS]NML89045.1 pilus assembly protein TadE [Sphingobium sp. TB-6]